MKKVKIEPTLDVMRALAAIMPLGHTVRFNVSKSASGNKEESLWIVKHGGGVPGLLPTGRWFVVFNDCYFIMSEEELQKELTNDFND